MSDNVDLYEVLNLKHDCTHEEIEKRFQKLVLKFHPDKYRADHPEANENERREMTEIYQLIIHVYQRLADPQKRADYDKMYKLSKQSNSSHTHLKNSFEEFMEHEASKPKLSKEEQEKAFEREMKEMDRKGKFNSEEQGAMKRSELKKALRDKRFEREQDDIENMPERLFDGHPDMAKFNEIFDKRWGQATDIVPHVGNPMAFNAGVEPNFGELEQNNTIDTPANPNDITNKFAPFQIDRPQVRVSKSDVDNAHGVDYYKGHNSKSSNYKRELEQRMKERERQTAELAGLKFADFTGVDTDPTLGGYGISHALGDVDNPELVEEDTDLREKQRRLIEFRRLENGR